MGREQEVTMSWDGYIDSILGNANVTGTNSDKAAIIGQDGSIWTGAHGGKGMTVAAAEAATIAKCITSKDFSPLQASGIVLEGLKYQFLSRKTERSFRERRKTTEL